MTQHDFNFVAEFIRDNFDQLTLDEDDAKKPGFKLEKVGQYLRKEDLQFPADNSKNPWIKFCDREPVMDVNTFLYPVKPNKSLVQVQQILEDKVEVALTKPTTVIGRNVTVHVCSSYSLHSISSRKRLSCFHGLHNFLSLMGASCTLCSLLRHYLVITFTLYELQIPPTDPKILFKLHRFVSNHLAPQKSKRKSKSLMHTRTAL